MAGDVPRCGFCGHYMFVPHDHSEGVCTFGLLERTGTIGNAPDEEHIDPHGECAAEIHRLQALLREAEEVLKPLEALATRYGEAHRLAVDKHNDEGGRPPKEYGDSFWVYVELGVCRRARSVLAKLVF